MTALNWEKDRANRLPKERSFDDLPPVGSYADRVRCGVYEMGRRSYSVHRAAQRPSPVRVASRGQDFDQLERYLQHAQQPDFRRKAAIQQAEILQFIRKLIVRCDSWAPSLAPNERSMIHSAKLFIQAQAH